MKAQPVTEDDMTSREADNLLFEATKSGDCAVAEQAFAQGADPNAQKLGWWTALHDAIRHDRLAVAKMLIDRKADVNAHEKGTRDKGIGDELGNTPSHIAAYFRNAAAMRLLLENGADPDARGEWNRTPLHVVSFNGDIESVRALVEHGADLSLTTDILPRDKGKTPLDLATEQGNVEIIDILQKSAEQHKGHAAGVPKPNATHVDDATDRGTGTREIG
jgi:ankyrin repeat protein